MGPGGFVERGSFVDVEWALRAERQPFFPPTGTSPQPWWGLPVCRTVTPWRPHQQYSAKRCSYTTYKCKIDNKNQGVLGWYTE